MLLSRKPTAIPTANEALPGRDTPIVAPGRHLVLGTPIGPPFPEGTERAVFGMGCFWGAERMFWRAPGIYTTAVGYACSSDPRVHFGLGASKVVREIEITWPSRLVQRLKDVAADQVLTVQEPE
jgi:hypothetical protein